MPVLLQGAPVSHPGLPSLTFGRGLSCHMHQLLGYRATNGTLSWGRATVLLHAGTCYLPAVSVHGPWAVHGQDCPLGRVEPGASLGWAVGRSGATGSLGIHQAS